MKCCDPSIPKRITVISDKKRNALIVAGYYGALLGALYAANFIIFEAAFPPADQLFFITTATFAAYFYQKRICFSIHYPPGDRIGRWEIMVFSGCLLACFIAFLRFSFEQQFRIFAVLSLALSYHNHSRVHFFRRLPAIKNLILCATWILLLFWVFGPFHRNSLHFPTHIADFSVVLFAQSMLCDWDHRREDLAYDHKTLSNILPTEGVLSIAAGLYLTSIAIMVMQALSGHIVWQMAFAQIAMYFGYAMFLRRYVKNEGSGQLFWTDVILLAKAVMVALSTI